MSKLTTRILIFLTSFNLIWLSYTAWEKYALKSCASCNQVLFFPISSVAIALLGVVSSLFMLVIILLLNKLFIFKYVLLANSVVNAFVASFLQIAQFTQLANYCYLCLVATIVFYIIFIITLTEIVIKPMIGNTAN